MGQDQTALTATFATLSALWLAAGIYVYQRLLKRLGKEGGQVSSAEFGIMDLILCGLLLLWFCVAITSGFQGPQRDDVSQKDILHGAAIFVAIIAIIWTVMTSHGVNAFRQFGLFRRNPFVCGGIAAGLTLAAYPLMLLAEKLTFAAMRGTARSQNIVEFFLKSSRDSDSHAVYLTMGLAVIVAPIAEETIFRGYIYGVLKQRLGAVIAALISAAAFAAMHVNIPSLAPLFILALCLTVAYEATGSLLVNILMHSLFNLTMLLALLYVAQHPATP